MMTQHNGLFRNPHLEGDTFFWDGGRIGFLLFHGFTATTAEVRPLARVLHSEGYTVAGPLLPGHGTSPYEMNRCLWQEWAATAETAYASLAEHCDHIFVGGESMGGLLALYLAQQHPEIVSILTYAPAIKVPFSAYMKVLMPLIALFVPLILKPEPAPNAVTPRWQGYPTIPTQAAVQLLGLQRYVRAHLDHISQPLLIVQGKLDETVDPEGATILHRQISSELKPLYWMPQSTHCVLLDREQDQVTDITLEFIQQVLRERGIA